MKAEKDRSEDQAAAQVASIMEMVAKLEAAQTDEEREEAETVIHEDPLSLEIRSGWTCINDEMDPAEYKILLCTGGPAVQLIGELNKYNEPESPKVEHQDWGTPWTRYHTTEEQDVALLRYVQCFYFGD